MAGSEDCSGDGSDDGVVCVEKHEEAPQVDSYDSKCVFCKISRGQEPGTELLYSQDEDLVCFKDIRPGAPHHYLVVPKKHMGNCKTLTKDHIPLVKKMVEVGKTVLQRNHFNDLEDTRIGFHWPPFCTIAHLHLHVLAPASQLGFLSRMIYRINSYWFITEQTVRPGTASNTCLFAISRTK